ncbi:MAG: helix-turn-helix domain-containing protein [Nitrososphaerota archaeon]
MRRIPSDKAAEIVRLRARKMPVKCIVEELGIRRSTVYNYLGRFQAFADEAFIKELQAELDVFHRLYCDGNEELIPISDQAKLLAKLLRKYMLMPDEIIAQAILNAHWRRVQACWKRRRRST